MAPLSTPAKDFILHWGEMGGRWGVNRSQAQIHALLHISDRPLPADEIAETLGLARSNVSTALKELQAWGVVRIERQLEDRRDHFAALDDMVDLARRIVEGRRERELAPTIDQVRALVRMAEVDPTTTPYVEKRLRETLEVMELVDSWYRDMAALPRSTQIMLLKLGARIARFLPKAD